MNNRPATHVFSDAITVEAWIDSDVYQAEAMQAVVSKWRIGESFDRFDAYDASSTCGLDTRGYFGAVFDGRYVYFVPQNTGAGNAGMFLQNAGVFQGNVGIDRANALTGGLRDIATAATQSGAFGGGANLSANFAPRPTAPLQGGFSP